MKKTINIITILLVAYSAQGQWKHNINEGANPARALPYEYVELTPIEDLFLTGQANITTQTLNFMTQQLEDYGQESYPLDANGNYTNMLRIGLGDTLFHHESSIQYDGSNPASFRIKSSYNNQLTSIRNASATFNGAEFDVVNYTDSNFIQGVPAVTTARDSFTYNGGNLESMVMKVDTGAGMESRDQHRFVYNGTKVTDHYIDEWDMNQSMYVESERITIAYDGNGYVDSITRYDKNGASWWAGSADDFTHDASGNLTMFIELDEDGSGGLEPKQQWTFTIDGSSKITSIELFDYQGGSWEIVAEYVATYGASDSLDKLEQFAYFGGTQLTVPSAVWIFGDVVADSLPAAPDNLSLTPSNKSTDFTKMILDWTDNAVNETGFHIERSTDGATWAYLGSVGADVVSYTDTGLTAATTYHYRVQAYNATGTSSYSNEVSASTSTTSSVASASAIEVKVFPNPLENGNLTIFGGGEYRLTITSINGQTVFSNDRSEGTTVINRQQLLAGSYIVTIATAESVTSKRIVIN